jgi:hypothetical protein
MTSNKRQAFVASQCDKYPKIWLTERHQKNPLKTEAHQVRACDFPFTMTIEIDTE